MPASTRVVFTLSPEKIALLKSTANTGLESGKWVSTNDCIVTLVCVTHGTLFFATGKITCWARSLYFYIWSPVHRRPDCPVMSLVASLRCCALYGVSHNRLIPWINTHREPPDMRLRSISVQNSAMVSLLFIFSGILLSCLFFKIDVEGVNPCTWTRCRGYYGLWDCRGR